MAIEDTAVQGFNYEILFGGSDTDISGQSNSVSLSPTKNADEVTTFGVEYRVKMAGIRDWNGSLQIFYNEEDNEAFELLWAAWASNDSYALKLSPAGGAVGDQQWSGDVIITEVSHEAAPDGGPVVVSVAWEGTGTLGRAAVS